MRDPARIDGVLARIGEAWKKSPDLRLGQLLMGPFTGPLVLQRFFNIEDEVLANKVESLFDKPSKE